MGTKRITAIPKATAARIIMKAGAKRVSAGAADEFVDVLEDLAENIAKRAVEIAKHTKRKTVHEGDIKIAAK